MNRKIRSAARVLRTEGIRSLAQETSLYLARRTSYGNQLLYQKSLDQIEARKQSESGLDDVLDTVLNIRPGYRPYEISAIQLRDEIKSLANLIKEDEPQTVLEIGTASGGTLYIWSRYLDSVSRLVSLDLPGGRFGGGYNKKKIGLFREFAPEKEMHFVRDNSHEQSTFDAVSDIIDEVDFLFIDGDHTYDGVKQDFEMYSELVSQGGTVCLHDIVEHPDDKETVRQRRSVEGIEDRHLVWGESHPDCNVDQFWSELKRDYDTTEIISHPDQTWGGIGVVNM